MAKTKYFLNEPGHLGECRFRNCIDVRVELSARPSSIHLDRVGAVKRRQVMVRVEGHQHDAAVRIDGLKQTKISVSISKHQNQVFDLL